MIVWGTLAATHFVVFGSFKWTKLVVGLLLDRLDGYVCVLVVLGVVLYSF